MCFAPTVNAQSPSYDLVFEPTTSESVIWRPYLFGMPADFRHIYGNFSISLINPVNVDYVLFRFGDYNASAEIQESLGWDDVVLNLTADPFVWEFNTLDLPEGVHRFEWEATHYRNTTASAFLDNTLEPEYWVHVGGSTALYIDHQDSSQQDALYNTLSIVLIIGLVAVTVSVSVVVLHKIMKNRPKTIRRSRFERGKVE
ncbi:MAG: hypothetical protein RTU63_11655 [Candidatus Thorarchaeota archaeon]